MISSLPWSLNFLFSTPFWITSPNSFLLQPLFTISAPPIILSFSFPALSRIPSPNSTASFLPQTPYRLISALTPPPFPFLFLPSTINCIQDYYYLIFIIVFICIRLLFMFCYFYLVFYVVKSLRVIFKIGCKFWYYIILKNEELSYLPSKTICCGHP
jgi:hypothetical protein